MRNKPKFKKHLLSTSPFFLSLFSLMISLLTPSQQCRGMGNGRCDQFIM